MDCNLQLGEVNLHLPPCKLSRSHKTGTLGYTAIFGGVVNHCNAHPGLVVVDLHCIKVSLCAEHWCTCSKAVDLLVVGLVQG